MKSKRNKTPKLIGTYSPNPLSWLELHEYKIDDIFSDIYVDGAGIGENNENITKYGLHLGTVRRDDLLKRVGRLLLDNRNIVGIDGQYNQNNVTNCENIAHCNFWSICWTNDPIDPNGALPFFLLELNQESISLINEIIIQPSSEELIKYIEAITSLFSAEEAINNFGPITKFDSFTKAVNQIERVDDNLSKISNNKIATKVVEPDEALNQILKLKSKCKNEFFSIATNGAPPDEIEKRLELLIIWGTKKYPMHGTVRIPGLSHGRLDTHFAGWILRNKKLN